MAKGVRKNELSAQVVTGRDAEQFDRALVFCRAAIMALIALAACCALALTGCSQQQNGDGDVAGGDTSVQQDQAVEGITLDVAGMDLDYSDRDLSARYDEAAAVFVTLNGSTATVRAAADDTADAADAAGKGDAESQKESTDSSAVAAVLVEGSTVTIAAEGTYVVSGALDNGQLVVDAPEDAKVQLVLDGATIHNETGPAVYVKQADKCFVTLAEGSANTLTDGAAYELEAESDEPYATLFSKADLALNGEGSLEVRGAYRHAICSKDDLVFGGGTYVVTSVEDAVRGRDCVKVFDGDFTITAGDAAVKSNNDEDGARGFVLIDGGTFEVSAVGDAFHAETLLRVNGGIINVTACEEGLEGWQVTVNDGDIHVVSSDDAINAAAPDTAVGTVSAEANALMEGANESCLFEMNGGYVWVDAGGDGVDSNGYVSVTGGTLLVLGPADNANGSFDYAYEATVTGGTVLMVGPAGMTQSFTSGEQAFFMANASGQAGQTVAVADEQGNVLASLTAVRPFASVLASAPGMVDGATYQVVVGGTVEGANADGFADAGTVAGGFYTAATASMQGVGMGGVGMGGMAPGGMMPNDGGMGDPGNRGERGELREMPDGTLPDGEPPEGFDPSQMPEGMEPGMRPEGGQAPEGFDAGTPSEGMESGVSLGGMEPGAAPEGLGAGMRSQTPDPEQLSPEGQSV